MPVGYRVGSNPRRIITLVIVLAATLFAQQTQAPAPCLTRPAAERAYQQDRLLNMVRSNDPARASFLIRTCGVAAAFTPELEQALRAAGPGTPWSRRCGLPRRRHRHLRHRRQKRPMQRRNL